MGSIKILRQKCFVSVLKVSVGRILWCFNYLGYRKLSIRGRRLSRFSVESFLCHSAEKIRRVETFSVSLISGIEEFFCFRGLCQDYRISVEVFLSDIADKFFRGTL